jgi:RNA polymerase sigma-70 factor (ECF subfamily)
MATSSLALVHTGDPRAIKDCIARYAPLVWSLARRLSPSASDAEDAVQEIFVDLWRSAARFDPAVASETAFVAMIARRRLIDRRRRRQRRPDTEPLSNAPTTAQANVEGRDAELCSEAALANRALSQLRPEQRTILVLAVYHGMSHDEIARSTGMPLGTVKAHVRRGLLRVRAILAGQGNAAMEGTA